MDNTHRIERRVKLHDVRVLMSVVQAGSMSKAAERLGTAQPALSRSIAELEHALGVRLFCPIISQYRSHTTQASPAKDL